jgi:hypothetical protein
MRNDDTDYNTSSWYDELKLAMRVDGENFDARICTRTEDQLREKFDAGFGGTNGKPFTAWGKDWVYFPLEYDGAESVGHAPRNPCDIAMEHQ